MSSNNGQFDDPAEGDDRINDYDIIKPIGKGKFAIVYRAKRIKDDLVVALKKISIEAMDEKQRTKTLKEVRLLQSLDHPNIVRYLDSFIHGDELIIVVEWAAAGDLKRQLRKAQERGSHFEERVIWKYFSQICEAMAHMHSKRIMHRDLKPANIFLTLNGEVKVGDLGLGRELSENTLEARSKVGTPLYMSPEVLRGDGYDFKSDVWSVGCLLYELAKLKSPFKKDGLNLYLLFQNISKGEYSPLPDHFSDELKNLAYSMISTNPIDRPDIQEVCRVAREMKAKYSQNKNEQKNSEPVVEPELDDDKEEDTRPPRAGQETPNKIPPEDFQEDKEETPDRKRVPPSVFPEKKSKPQLPDPTEDEEPEYKKEEPTSRETTKPRKPDLKADARSLLERDSLCENVRDKDKRPGQNDNGVPLPSKERAASPAPSSNAVLSKKNFPDAGTQSAMETVWDNLSILKYPGLNWQGNKPPLHRTHFSMENADLVHPRQQYEDMVNVAVWLLSEMGVEHGLTQPVIQVTPPITIATEILSSCQMAGLSGELARSITPISMRSGCGENVCLLLCWLSQETVNRRRSSGVIRATLDYHDETGLVDHGNDEDETEEIIDDDMEGEKDDQSQDDAMPYNFREEVGEQSGAGTFFSRSMIAATVDPAVWREELERVGTLLRSNSTSVKPVEYMHHIEIFHRHLDHFAKFGVGAQKTQEPVLRSTLNQGMMRANIHNDPKVETPCYDAISLISDLGDEVGKARESISRGEDRVNNTMSLLTLNREYQNVKSHLDVLEGKRRELSDLIKNKMEELQDANDTLNELNDQLKEKGSGMSDTSGLIHIKAALKNLKADINQMEITIGLRQVAVWGFHQKSAARKGRSSRKINSDALDESQYSIEDSLSPLAPNQLNFGDDW